jgi:hypothetical protein
MYFTSIVDADLVLILMPRFKRTHPTPNACSNRQHREYSVHSCIGNCFNFTSAAIVRSLLRTGLTSPPAVIQVLLSPRTLSAVLPRMSAATSSAYVKAAALTEPDFILKELSHEDDNICVCSAPGRSLACGRSASAGCIRAKR